MGSDVDGSVNGEKHVAAGVNAYRIPGTSPGDLIREVAEIARELPVARSVGRLHAAQARAVVGARTGMVQSRPQSIVVWDEIGDVFRYLRRARINVPLWRVSELPARRDLAEVDLAIAALNRPSDWATIASLVRRLPTVVVGLSPDRADAGQALRSGAFGYLSIGLHSTAVRRAIAGALRGEPAYSRAVLGERMRSELGATAARRTRAVTLTPRQREVVALIARGASDKEIATALGIATATAQKHVTHVLRRLDVPNRAAAVAATLWAAPAS